MYLDFFLILGLLLYFYFLPSINSPHNVVLPFIISTTSTLKLPPLNQSIIANVYIKSIQKNNNFIKCVTIPNSYQKNKWFYLQEYLL